MATTKTRRLPPTTPKAVAMQTPKRKGAKQAQQAVLDNFDVEIEHRTRDMRTNLDNALSAFLALADADLLMIPRAMLSMTLGDLESCWAGSFSETHMALAKKQFSSLHPERDEAEVVAAAKRKRAQSPSTPSRSSKNPRKAAVTPAAAGAGKRRTTAKKSIKSAAKTTLPAATGKSTLPQDHVFNPHLPKTPKLPRAPRRNESFFSAAGSPVDVNAEHTDSEASSDSDELPDPEVMERRALSQSQSGSQRSASARSKAKRAPSLLFRQGTGSEEGTEISIKLSDGRMMVFDPTRAEPGQIDAELAESGLDEDEKRRVKARLQEEVVRALTARMAEWSALKD